MRVAVGSDERTHLTDAIVQELHSLGHEVELYGPLAGQSLPWPEVSLAVAQRVADQQCQMGILCCWTGTGVSIAANKVSGIRAALCGDAETARGARLWNDANVLCLSLRSISETIAKEILEAWFNTKEVDQSEWANIQRIKELDQPRAAKFPL